MQGLRHSANIAEYALYSPEPGAAFQDSYESSLTFS